MHTNTLYSMQTMKRVVTRACIFSMLKAANLVDRGRAWYTVTRRAIVAWWMKIREEMLGFSVEVLEVIMLRLNSLRVASGR